MLRRTFVKALGAVPLSATLGQKIDNSPKLANQFVQSSALGSMKSNESCAQAAVDPTPPDNSWVNPVRKWLKKSPEYREEVRASINEETHVTYIDPDLLAMRSLSTAARIYYMRQRLVDRQLAYQFDELPDRSMYRIHDKWVEIARKVLGI